MSNSGKLAGHVGTLKNKNKQKDFTCWNSQGRGKQSLNFPRNFAKLSGCLFSNTVFLWTKQKLRKGRRQAQSYRCHFECKLHMVSVGVCKTQRSALWEFFTVSVMALYLITLYIFFFSAVWYRKTETPRVEEIEWAVLEPVDKWHPPYTNHEAHLGTPPLTLFI